MIIDLHSALKHVLRDPDVIMVGEMRTTQACGLRVERGGNRPLVLTTIHSTTAPQAVSNIEYFPMDERSQVRMALAANLQAIICQRLICY